MRLLSNVIPRFSSALAIAHLSMSNACTTTVLRRRVDKIPHDAPYIPLHFCLFRKINDCNRHLSSCFQERCQLVAWSKRHCSHPTPSYFLSSKIHHNNTKIGIYALKTKRNTFYTSRTRKKGKKHRRLRDSNSCSRRKCLSRYPLVER
jgi:hypothetical protein